MKKNIIIGTRGSILALAQAEYVKKELEKNYSDLEFEIKVIKTQGDKDLESNWENTEESLKSFFTKEIEQELLDEKIDIAVHSMKDMPIESPKGLICGAIPEREDVRDVLISKDDKMFPFLAKNAVVGTSSQRRAMNLKNVRPSVQIKHLRGNIHTRLQKLDDGEYDAIVLAAAGLKRVGLTDRITEYLNGEIFPPAPAQGILYIQCRENDNFIKEILTKINDEETVKIAEIEREFSRIFDGGCHTPMGCFSKTKGDEIEFFGMISENNKVYKDKVIGKISVGKKLAEDLANKIKEKMSK